MAETNVYDVDANPTVYFYVNKQSGQVEYVSMYWLFGITVRPKGQSWTMGTRDDLEKYYSPDYEIWSFDWESLDSTPGSAAHVDPDNDEDWELELVNAWGSNKDLTRDDIKDTFKLVNSGEYITAEEAEKIPGEV
jgi:hypothetical protein